MFRCLGVFKCSRVMISEDQKGVTKEGQKWPKFRVGQNRISLRGRPKNGQN